ncbi:MAG TPA: hypothetical protein VHT91_46805 [Kofleriaceae bacterium]|jgi:hypothetical protein|nr:hypothetical protein [Kofleriaceae bacterium]
MKATWAFHRLLRPEYRWVDSAEADAESTSGVLAKSERELEATLSLDGLVEIRDVLWPLAWRFCLEPISMLLAGAQPEWRYRCFDQPKSYTLRISGHEVRVLEERGKEVGFPARALWPALMDAGARVLAWTERDRGAADPNVATLRPSLERAEVTLREYGLLAAQS